MARPKSVILSKEEKKTIVASLKAQIKTVCDSTKALVVVRKDADKVFSLASKAHIAALKENDKLVIVADKALASLKAQLEALVAPVAATA